MRERVPGAAAPRRLLAAAKRRFPRVFWRLRNGVALVEWWIARRRGAAAAYGPRFFASHSEGDWEGLARSILAFAPARRVVDVGCGDGNVLAGFRAADPGLELLGLEASAAALERARRRGLPVEACDLARRGAGEEGIGRFQPDLAVSLEVAEHLPPWRAGGLVRLLARAPVVAFSAAQPNQGGVLHVNEQPPAYWIRRFTDERMRLHPRNDEFRATVASLGLAPWYAANIQLFVRA